MLNKGSMRKKTLEDMRTEIIREIKSEQEKGTLGGPLDFEAKWETLRKPIFDNPVVSASFVYLDITEEEIKGMLRGAYDECGVELA